MTIPPVPHPPTQTDAAYLAALETECVQLRESLRLRNKKIHALEEALRSAKRIIKQLTTASLCFFPSFQGAPRCPWAPAPDTTPHGESPHAAP